MPSRGVAGPEAANNASAAGMFVPMLALGVPVTATASVMLAALTNYGIQPGPQLMTEQPDLVWTLLASLLIGNLLLLVLNLPLAPLWARLLRIPRPQLYAGILFFACLGAYATNQDPFDIGLLLVFGLLGVMMRRFGLPVLPVILGVILGPRLEEKLREALAISGRRRQRAVVRAPGRHRVRRDGRRGRGLRPGAARPFHRHPGGSVRPRRPSDDRDEELVRR